MSKKKKKIEAQVQEETINTTEKPQKRWSFPTVSKCPRCGLTDTICRRTDNKLGRQYRICQRAVCRKTYTVFGEKV